jgi:hypothetical protein
MSADRGRRSEIRAGAGARAVLAAAAATAAVFAGFVAHPVGAGASAAVPLSPGRMFHFKSPSGNIQCRMNAEAASCLLLKSNWRRLRPRPANCDLDWSPTDMAMYLDTRQSRWKLELGACRGDIGPLCYGGDPCSVLRYGHSVTSVVRAAGVRGIRCASARNGITCTKIGRTPGNRGFRIARQGYAVL